MSTSDANHLSGSPVLRSPEQEIALSAVICTYNRYDLLPEAIESQVKQDVPADLFEIIVVDNSPDQAGAARFGQRYSGLSNLTYLVEPKPGLSNARNKGTAAALGRIVASTLMPHLTAERGLWAARLCRVGQTRNRHGLTSRRSAISRLSIWAASCVNCPQENGWPGVTFRSTG
jgi:glycosyltransferase involved in cell wall biosynthesis